MAGVKFPGWRCSPSEPQALHPVLFCHLRREVLWTRRCGGHLWCVAIGPVLVLPQQGVITVPFLFVASPHFKVSSTPLPRKGKTPGDFISVCIYILYIHIQKYDSFSAGNPSQGSRQAV